MFTGIIEDVGELVSLERKGRTAKVTVKAGLPLGEIEIGESIAVNGACLTLERLDGGALVFHALAETMRRTNLASLRQGDPVNLERALRLGDRLGGHLVSGHVDATGKVTACRRNGDDLELTVAIPDNADFPVVPKGSIAINGVSLTIARINGHEVTVCLIPHTWKATNLQFAKPGTLLNLEADMLGKYVQQAIRAQSEPKRPITLSTLSDAGF